MGADDDAGARRDRVEESQARLLAAGEEPLADHHWQPAQLAAGRPTFATFALRAGISTFDLSRYMGARLTMIDRHYSVDAEPRGRRQ